MKRVLVLLAVAGCAMKNAGDQRLMALESVPTVALNRASDAEALIAGLYQLPEGSAEVRWAVAPLPRGPHDQAVDGTTIGCDIWVEWWGPSWTSGASADGPAISATSFAHEMAHCALWLRGEDDPQHTRTDWWGPGGAVSRANDALRTAGL